MKRLFSFHDSSIEAKLKQLLIAEILRKNNEYELIHLLQERYATAI